LVERCGKYPLVSSMSNIAGSFLKAMGKKLRESIILKYLNSIE
jgi:hypothetical protein